MIAASVLLLLPVRFSQGYFNPIRRPHCLDHSRQRHRTTLLSTTMSSDANNGFYLLKSEPAEFSIQDLEKNVVQEWDGVRNFQARNNMRTMRIGDRAFFYHSNCRNAGIVGTVLVTREAQPDATAYKDPNHAGYDPKSTADNCRWDSVEIKFDTVFPVTVTLKELKAQAKRDEVLAQMTLLKNGRLSVHRVTAGEWSAVEELVDRKVAGENIGET